LTDGEAGAYSGFKALKGYPALELPVTSRAGVFDRYLEQIEAVALGCGEDKMVPRESLVLVRRVFAFG
jgi:hypothetical protein